ncbi:hypothetical protein QP940_07925 [Corynebacterium pseudodiphtheriticum]|uniref:hypothetical protein n=1 Tax=Corynebacterium pseudodiphtheriticum TaxID=37637 RepID=UPI00254A20F6|nr:hypothetical protein [Corynebacterium pseudodiphtheriticum]MDK8614550.1 hypothetical protein [Corynebacterium pseudodiphtheriticum]MDK8738626.1 hypothetical protein [Corynebacterium pseudodiphtheriticum]MDK8745168.1 hypothetical protein [Corynebacterium pseudodiphtheriticum]
MSDDKQLTVAELLARAGKENSDGQGKAGAQGGSGARKSGSDSEKPRRRRRRSMEDGGGVSVAELTGSFPKVTAKPKESKHGSPIDETSSGETSSGETSSNKGAKAANAGSEAAHNAATEKPSGPKAPVAAEKKQPATQSVSPATPPTTRKKSKTITVGRKSDEKNNGGIGTKTGGQATSVQGSSQEKVSSASAGASGSAAGIGNAAKGVGIGNAGNATGAGSAGNAAGAGSAKAPEKPTPASDETAEISRVTDTTSARTEGGSDKQNQRPNGRDQKNHERKETSRKDSETTGEIPRVQPGKPVDKTAKTADTASQSVKPGKRADDDTSEFQNIPDSLTQAAAGAPVGGAGQDGAKSTGINSTQKKAAQGAQQTGQPDNSAQENGQPSGGPSPVHADADQDDAVSEGEGMSPVAVILLALVGIVLGVVVFKGFEMLWGALNNYLVAALAVGVTGVMAGIVHALRTERDGLSMTLTAIVGLLLTFGPAILVVL